MPDTLLVTESRLPSHAEHVSVRTQFIASTEGHLFGIEISENESVVSETIIKLCLRNGLLQADTHGSVRLSFLSLST